MSSEATPLAPAAEPGSADERIMIINTAEMNPVDYDWGAIKWICDRKTTPNSQQSFGYAFLNPGGVNPEHRHRTAEEIIYMLAGELKVYAHGDCITLRPGQTALIPPGVRHKVVNEGWEPVVYIASFSAPFRDTIFKGQTGRLDAVEKLY
ncbi:MAG TPA: cupin domain-containing protein [Blastocatellia bacterium]|nr:cupin domain-containing protein [Blastocatellia bacterium]